MTVYAKNKDAVAICNRSGQKMMRSDMVEDGYLRGLLVHPDWYDPYHPQERPFDPDEGIAIYRPAPDLMPIPPGPSLLIHSVAGGAPGFTNVSLAITQPNPPGSTVTRWELWRSPAGANTYTRVATQLPAAPNFIPAPDLLGTEQLNQVPQGVVTSANIGTQFATITDTTAVTGSSYNYYVITDTADTSNTQSPNQFPNGLQSAPTFVNSLGQTVSGTPGSGPGFIPKTQVALIGVLLASFNSAQTKYLYSSDGVTWNTGTLPAACVGQMAYGGVTSKLWVQLTGASGQTLYTSPDGVNWTTRTNVLPAVGVWAGVAWSPTLGLFVACQNGTNNAAQVATSPDGITWTSRSTPSGLGNWTNVTWSPRLGLFLVANGGAALPTTPVMTSPDGINWTYRSTSSGNNVSYIIDMGPALDVVGWSNGSTTWAISADGINWVNGVNPGSFPGGGNTAVNLIGPINGFAYVMVGSSSQIADRTNVANLGSGWATAASNVSSVTTTGACFPAFSAALGLWVTAAGGLSSPNPVMTTTDGIHYNTILVASGVNARIQQISAAA